MVSASVAAVAVKLRQNGGHLPPSSHHRAPARSAHCRHVRRWCRRRAPPLPSHDPAARRRRARTPSWMANVMDANQPRKPVPPKPAGIELGDINIAGTSNGDAPVLAIASKFSARSGSTPRKGGGGDIGGGGPAGGPAARVAVGAHQSGPPCARRCRVALLRRRVERRGRRGARSARAWASRSRLCCCA